MDPAVPFSSPSMRVALAYQGEKRSACPTCFKRFTFRKSLKRHMDSVHRLTCTLCRRSYKNERRLEIHRCMPKNTAAVKRKPFLCDSCGSEYSSLQNLELHTRRYHSTTNKRPSGYRRRRHSCNQCPKKFTSHQYLQQHITKTHLYPEEKFECAVCGAAYRHGSILREHIEVVHLKLYACTICSKDHVNQKSLDAHLDEVHDGVSLF